MGAATGNQNFRTGIREVIKSGQIQGHIVNVPARNRALVHMQIAVHGECTTGPQQGDGLNGIGRSRARRVQGVRAHIHLPVAGIKGQSHTGVDESRVIAIGGNVIELPNGHLSHGCGIVQNVVHGENRVEVGSRAGELNLVVVRLLRAGPVGGVAPIGARGHAGNSDPLLCRSRS